jgi:hypothetical protein
MGRSDHFADMNEVYVRMEIAHKEQTTIRLWHMNGGPNGCGHQPIRDLRRQKANLSLNVVNTRRINSGL